MDKELKKKGNTGLVIVIVILALLVAVLGYYYVSHEFLNSNSEVEKTEKNATDDNNKESDQSDEKEIEYQFDADKIVNKDDTYVYSLSNNIDNFIPYRKNDKECRFIYGDSNEILNGSFTTIVSAQVFKGGPGVTDSFVFLIEKSGNLYYANIDRTQKVITGNISQVKDVVKLYVIDLTSDRQVSPEGSTVVAQTKDGSLYDLYEYVKK